MKNEGWKRPLKIPNWFFLIDNFIANLVSHEILLQYLTCILSSYIHYKQYNRFPPSLHATNNFFFHTEVFCRLRGGGGGGKTLVH